LHVNEAEDPVVPDRFVAASDIRRIHFAARQQSMSDELEKLLEAARYRPLTPAEQEEQRRSFAFGNANIENVRVTREIVDAQAEELKEKR
jgi:hypothetical protein